MFRFCNVLYGLELLDVFSPNENDLKQLLMFYSLYIIKWKFGHFKMIKCMIATIDQKLI